MKCVIITEYGETIEHTGVDRIGESGDQVSLYDSDGNLLAVVAKDRIVTLDTTEESN